LEKVFQYILLDKNYIILISIPHLPGNVNKDFLILLLIAYFSLAIILSIIGRKRNIGIINTFLLSTLLTPVIGFLFLINSPKIRSRKNKSHTRKIYKCKSCGYEFREPFEICSVCGALKKEKITDNREGTL
jgi:hypothetical protein